jgi:cyclic pyranopterin phosphate synthase
MVDVSAKAETTREAEAEAVLWVGPEVMRAVRDGRVPKGNIFETARIAGIMAAKRTSDLIPLCHPLKLTHVSVDMEQFEDRIVIRAKVRTHASTGVEMEADGGIGGRTDFVRHAQSAVERNAIRRIEAAGKIRWPDRQLPLGGAHWLMESCCTFAFRQRKVLPSTRSLRPASWSNMAWKAMRTLETGIAS